MRVEATDSLCTGCRLCQMVCALRQFGEHNPKKSSIRINSRLMDNGHYHIAVCDQCGECEGVCPTGAIEPQNGVYTIIEENCVSCLVCLHECPHGVLTRPAGAIAPRNCVVCGDCVEICPTRALALVP